MDGSNLAIVGGGMVAGYAAKHLAELGWKGSIAILSSDSALPYERPPLSKGLLAGRENETSVLINPHDFYRDRGIEVRLGCVVTSIDSQSRRLKLRNGGEFAFEKLIVATGAQPRKFSNQGSEAGNVLYLRSLDDSKKIRDRMTNAKRAAVIGSGFIGMEVASVLASKQIETTMILREDRVWKQFFTPEMSKFFEDYFSARGVRFVKNATIGRFTPNSVELADGRAIDCEFAVAGIGAVPVTDLFPAASDGVMVNESLETDASGIWAAGDMVNYPDLIFEKRRRVEHWDNAVSQAQHCAKVLTGDRTPFRHVPYFFSDVFDLSYEFWGDAADANQVVTRGEIASGSFSVWWLRDGIVRAAFILNRPPEERDSAPQWIERKEKLK